MSDDALYRCALYYGRADSEEEFKRARSVLAESIIRAFTDTPKYPLRVTNGFETKEWLRVAASAIEICQARMWPEDEDVTAPMHHLKAAGKKWIGVARWTPEPWRT